MSARADALETSMALFVNGAASADHYQIGLWLNAVKAERAALAKLVEAAKRVVNSESAEWEDGLVTYEVAGDDMAAFRAALAKVSP